MNEFYFYVLSLGQQVSKADNTAALIVLYKKKREIYCSTIDTADFVYKEK